MTHDTIERLTNADPERDVDPVPPEDLLAQILATPRPPEPDPQGTRWSITRSRLAIAAGTLAICMLLAVLLLDTRGPHSLALAAQAYTQTAAEPAQIIYTSATFVTTTQTGHTATRTTGRIEEWHRGSETHRIETSVSQNGTETALDHVIDSDGVMHQITQDGTYRIVRKPDNQDAANVITQHQAGFIAEFRTRYEHGELDPGGDVQFAGRPARRYLVVPKQPDVVPEQPNGSGPYLSGPQQAYYIDRETGAPLGFTSTLNVNTSTPQDGLQPLALQSVQTVRTIRRLDPTPANLKALRTLSLPRRRDANGCIRGPVTDARNSDTASKSGCGGTPHAPLPD